MAYMEITSLTVSVISMVKKSLPEGDVLFTYDDKDRVTSIQASDYHYSYQYGSAGGSYGNSLVHVEELKSGLWSQHVYNRYGLPIEYYDSFQIEEPKQPGKKELEAIQRQKEINLRIAAGIFQGVDILFFFV